MMEVEEALPCRPEVHANTSRCCFQFAGCTFNQRTVRENRRHQRSQSQFSDCLSGLVTHSEYGKCCLTCYEQATKYEMALSNQRTQSHSNHATLISITSGLHYSSSSPSTSSLNKTAIDSMRHRLSLMSFSQTTIFAAELQHEVKNLKQKLRRRDATLEDLQAEASRLRAALHAKQENLDEVEKRIEDTSDEILFKEGGKLTFGVLDAAAELHSRCKVAFNEIDTAFNIVAGAFQLNLRQKVNSEYLCRLGLLMRSDSIMFHLAKALGSVETICISVDETSLYNGRSFFVVDASYDDPITGEMTQRMLSLTEMEGGHSAAQMLDEISRTISSIRDRQSLLGLPIEQQMFLFRIGSLSADTTSANSGEKSGLITVLNRTRNEELDSLSSSSSSSYSFFRQVKETLSDAIFLPCYMHVTNLIDINANKNWIKLETQYGMKIPDCIPRQSNESQVHSLLRQIYRHFSICPDYCAYVASEFNWLRKPDRVLLSRWMTRTRFAYSILVSFDHLSGYCRHFQHSLKPRQQSISSFLFSSSSTSAGLFLEELQVLSVMSVTLLLPMLSTATKTVQECENLMAQLKTLHENDSLKDDDDAHLLTLWKRGWLSIAEGRAKMECEMKKMKEKNKGLAKSERLSMQIDKEQTDMVLNSSDDPWSLHESPSKFQIDLLKAYSECLVDQLSKHAIKPLTSSSSSSSHKKLSTSEDEEISSVLALTSEDWDDEDETDDELYMPLQDEDDERTIDEEESMHDIDASIARLPANNLRSERHFSKAKNQMPRALNKRAMFLSAVIQIQQNPDISIASTTKWLPFAVTDSLRTRARHMLSSARTRRDILRKTYERMKEKETKAVQKEEKKQQAIDKVEKITGGKLIDDENGVDQLLQSQLKAQLQSRNVKGLSPEVVAEIEKISASNDDIDKIITKARKLYISGPVEVLRKRLHIIIQAENNVNRFSSASSSSLSSSSSISTSAPPIFSSNSSIFSASSEASTESSSNSSSTSSLSYSSAYSVPVLPTLSPSTSNSASRSVRTRSLNSNSNSSRLRSRSSSSSRSVSSQMALEDDGNHASDLGSYLPSKGNSRFADYWSI